MFYHVYDQKEERFIGMIKTDGEPLSRGEKLTLLIDDVAYRVYYVIRRFVSQDESRYVYNPELRNGLGGYIDKESGQAVSNHTALGGTIEETGFVLVRPLSVSANRWVTQVLDDFEKMGVDDARRDNA